MMDKNASGSDGGFPKEAILTLLLVLIAVFIFHYCTAHAVPPTQLEKLKVGMSWTEAQKIMGPQQGRPVLQPDGSYYLGIGRRDRWCTVCLTLDANLRITSIFHDH